MAIVCPRCDGNGLIEKIRIKSFGITLYVCDECEATWFHPSTISFYTFIPIESFLEARGIEWSDKELEKIGYYEGEKYETDNKLDMLQFGSIKN